MNGASAAGLVALLLIFLVCREIVCWYWKINQNTRVLEEILKEQKRTNAILYLKDSKSGAESGISVS